MLRGFVRNGSKRRRPLFNRVSRGLALVVSAMAWALVVWVWPDLQLGNGSGSRSLQPAVLIAAASIEAAAVLFGLAVGAIVLQVMAKYSWTVVRSVLPGWLAPVLVLVIGAGVVFPLWVSFSPTSRLSTAAFAAFGWSILGIGATVWEAAQRMNPPSLSVRTRRRTLSVLSRDHRRGKASDEVAEILGQLAAEAELPYREGLLMVGSYVMVLADRARGDSRGEISAAIRALAERATSAESAALASGIVRALWVLGLDQAEHPQVFDEVHRALTAIVGEARRGGQRELARAALDALAGITASRVGRALPAVGYRTPPKPADPPPPPRRSDTGFFPPPVFPSSLPQVSDEAPATQDLSRASRQHLLKRFVEDFAAEDGAPAGTLAATLKAALPRLGETARHERPKWWDDYDLLQETVETFVAWLPSPQPASTGWPAGWQGHGTFDEDVQRLASLASCLYRQGKHVPSDLVEAALESIGVRLRAEKPAQTDLPPARTGWRYPPMRSEEGGIAAVTANSLSTLMSSAFGAGFDRRALSTGLRILASATASAQHGDRDATVAYVNALVQFTIDTSFHGLEAGSQAGSDRMEVVLIGVIAECDQLLSAACEQKQQRVHGIYEAVEGLANALAWRTPRPRMFGTTIAMLQTRLAAAGWPVSLPASQGRLHELDEPVKSGPPRPLTSELLRDAEELFAHWISHAEERLTMAALLTLWSHAACALREGSPGEAHRIAAFLTEQLRVHDKRYAEMPAPLAAPGEEQAPGFQPLDAHFRGVISAAAQWCARANPGITSAIPPASGPRTVRAVARWLVSQPDTANWTYRGGEDAAGTHLVTVEMPDQSRRVLRDRDVRTGQLRWGYTGTGAHDLSAVLLADILDCYRDCPDCFGVIALAANIIKCRSCSGTGMRRGTPLSERDLLTKVIRILPGNFERTRLEFLSAIAETQLKLEVRS
jgi:hypothetical protein